MYFGDAGSPGVLHSVGAHRAKCAVITLDTPGANYRTVWALNKVRQSRCLSRGLRGVHCGCYHGKQPKAPSGNECWLRGSSSCKFVFGHPMVMRPSRRRLSPGWHRSTSRT